jgi:hypothetical protein
MQKHGGKIAEFVRKHRNQTLDQFNNTLAMTFSQATRYYLILEIVQDRYREASRAYLDGTRAVQADPMTHDRDRSLDVSLHLHLEIENLYLFAKLFLDRTADALAYFFGFKWGGRGSTFSKLAEKYDGQRQYHKHLPPLPEPLRSLITQLKKEIVEHKTDTIEHVQESGLTHATTLSEELSPDGTTVIKTRIYPMVVGSSSSASSYQDTKTPDEIFVKLNAYIDALVDFLGTNIEVSPLFPVPAAKED